METKVGSLKGFLITTSFLEGSTGLGLMTVPSLLVNLLLGSPLTDPMSVILTKVGGSALVSLGIVCWFLRKSESNNGLIIALLFYNLTTVVLFMYAGLYEHLNGIALWPVVAIHIVMGSWCAKCLSFTGKRKSAT